MFFHPWVSVKIKLLLNNVMVLSIYRSNFLQRIGHLDDFWRKSTRQSVSNYWKVPVGPSQCTAMTALNTLSSWHIV